MPKGTSLEYHFTTDSGQIRDAVLRFRKESGEGDHQAFYDAFYFGNPLGDAWNTYCTHNEAIVGTENYLPQAVQLDGRIVDGAMGIDTLVHPKYRLFHGVFSGLCEKSLEDMQGRTDLLFCRPNEASSKYYTKYFGWTKPVSLGLYKKVIRDHSSFVRFCLSLLRRGKKGSALTLHRVESFASVELNAVIEQRQKTVDYSYFPKSTAFLDWKFLKNSYCPCDGFIIRENGNVVGYVVAKDSDGVRNILSFYNANDCPKTFRRLLSLLAFQAREDRIRMLTICCADGAWYETVIKRNFFIRRDEIEFLVKPLSKLAIPSNWIVQTGDFDIFE